MSSWHTIDMATGQKPRSWKLKLVLSPAILLSLCVWPVFKQLPSVHVCHLVHLCFFTANGFTEALIKSGISRSQWNGYVARWGLFSLQAFWFPQTTLASIAWRYRFERPCTGGILWWHVLTPALSLASIWPAPPKSAGCRRFEQCDALRTHLC